jgi:hypothetical protein
VLARYLSSGEHAARTLTRHSRVAARSGSRKRPAPTGIKEDPCNGR